MPQIKGILKSRSEVGFTSNDKKKRTFILDCSGNSKNFLEFVLYGDAVKDLNKYKNKEELYISYNPRGFISENKGKERLMQSLVVYSIENEGERIARMMAEKASKAKNK